MYSESQTLVQVIGLVVTSVATYRCGSAPDSHRSSPAISERQQYGGEDTRGRSVERTSPRGRARRHFPPRGDELLHCGRTTDSKSDVPRVESRESVAAPDRDPVRRQSGAELRRVLVVWRPDQDERGGWRDGRLHLTHPDLPPLEFDPEADPEALALQADLRVLPAATFVSKVTGIASDHPLYQPLADEVASAQSGLSGQS